MKIKLQLKGNKKGKLFFKLKLGDKNRYDFTTKTITLDREYADPFTLDHELGHAVMDELVFGNAFKVPKIPDYMIAVKYAWLTSLAPEGIERSDEGWAQSFCDYFNRPEYLKNEAPILYYFWYEVIDLNPEILDIHRELHNELEKLRKQP